MLPRMSLCALLACVALHGHAQAPASPTQTTQEPAPGSTAAASTGGAAATLSPTSSDSNLPAHVVRQQAAEIAKGDPARWYREDADLAAQMKTRRKEIAAGLQEAMGACRKQAASERRACQQAARNTYQQEMAGLRGGSVAGR